MAPHELFSLVSGLEVSDGSEADVLTQIRRYQKDQMLRSGVKESEEGTGERDNFDYIWDQSMERTEARDIPGTAKSNPKSPRSPKSPGPSLSKSPGKSPTNKSPTSSEYVGLTDDQLRKLKISLLANNEETEKIEPRKPSSIKFSDCSEFKTVDPDEKSDDN